MVYTGPSKGCLACLKRRVKCDEAKPQCQRCLKAGRECPGYRDPSRIKIRDMTATTINRFEYDRAGPRTREDDFFDQNYSQSVMTLRTRADEESVQSRGSYSVDDEEQIDLAGENSNYGSHSARSGEMRNTPLTNFFVSKPGIQVPPRMSIEQHAFAYFVNQYIDIKPQALDPGYLDVLKLVTSRQNKGECLESCLSTLALASFSRRPASRKVTIDTQASYSIALKAVNDAIGKPGSIFDDELLASILVLALVECLISYRVTGYYNHLYGGITILRSRGKRRFHDQLGAESFMLLRFELMRTSAIRFVEPQDQYSYDWVCSAMEIVDDPCLAAAHTMTADSKRHRLSTIIHTMINTNVGVDRPKTLLTLPPAFTTDAVLIQAVEESLDLVGMLKDYLEATTKAFLPVDLPGHPAEDFQARPCDAGSLSSTITTLPPEMQAYTWKSMEHASLGLSMLTSHLYGCNIAAKVVETVKHKAAAGNTPEYHRMAAKAREDVAILVGSIPYLFMDAEGVGGVSPNDYMWLHNAVPYTVALQSPFSDAQQRHYIKTAMQYIADVKGVKMTEGVFNKCQAFHRYATANRDHNVRRTPDNPLRISTC